MASGAKRLFIMAMLASLVLALLAPGCGQPPLEEAEEKGVNLPPIEDPEKGNPKLDSHLWRLIEAESEGKPSHLPDREA